MQALSMGIHESQSLLWERMVALSPPFSKYIVGKVRRQACYAGQNGCKRQVPPGNPIALKRIEKRTRVPSL